jgi:hypothetical protein
MKAVVTEVHKESSWYYSDGLKIPAKPGEKCYLPGRTIEIIRHRTYNNYPGWFSVDFIFPGIKGRLFCAAIKFREMK